ncbi:MAG: ATP-binding protein, partial [Flavobacteriaceae bacterium]
MALTSKDSIVGTNHGQHRTKYDFEEVVADIIDNSIDAKASVIDIEFKDTDYTTAGSPGGQGKSVKYKEGLGFLTGNRSYLLISDNGKGMTFDELHENLTRGSIREYEDYELGHFGIGLKDATLSQAYEITVFSKKKGHPMAALRMSSIWYQETGENEFMEPDKDFINQYEWMGKTDGYRKSVDLLAAATSGTIVLLEGLHKQEKKYGNSMSRSDYNTSIINLLDAHLGI